jgi:hypothetical protein
MTDAADASSILVVRRGRRSARGGARFSAALPFGALLERPAGFTVLVYRPHWFPPAAGGDGQSGKAPLVRFRARASLRRSPVAPCGPGDASTARTIPLRRYAGLAHPRCGRLAPAVFSVPSRHHKFGASSVRVIRGRCSPRLAYRARATDCSRDLAARCLRTRGDVRGIRCSTLRSYSSASRVSAPRRHRTRTHLPFRRRPPREGSSRELPGIGGLLTGRGRGSWGLAPRSGRAVRQAGPAIAFARRADPVSRPRLPWVFVLSRVFAAGPWPPLLAGVPPVGFSR